MKKQREPPGGLSPEAERTTEDPSTNPGERGQRLPESLDSEVLGRLRGILRASLGVGCATGAVYAALLLLLHDRRFAELLALAAIFVTGNARALRLVGRGEGARAVIFWSWMATAIVVLASVFVPFMFPSLVMMMLVATSLLISFASGRRLPTMLAVTLVGTLFIVAVGVFSPPGPRMPLWAARVIVLATVPMTAGLISSSLPNSPGDCGRRTSGLNGGPRKRPASSSVPRPA